MDNQKGTKARRRGKIHSDFERGFIRAEVISFDELVACGSMAAAKEGLVRARARIISCATVMLCFSDLTYKFDFNIYNKPRATAGSPLRKRSD